MSQTPQEPNPQNNQNSQYGNYQNPTENSYYYNPNSSTTPQGQGPTSAPETYGNIQGSYHNPNQSQPSSYAQSMGYGISSQPVEKPEAPQSVKIAVILTYLMAVLGLVSSMLQILFPEMAAGDLLSKMGLDQEDVPGFNEQFTGLDIAITAISSIFSLALYGVFAFFASRGAHWARIVLTVLHGFSCLGVIAPIILVFLSGFTPLVAFSFINVLLAIIAIVCFWLTPSNNFYRQMKAYNQWKTYSQYN